MLHILQSQVHFCKQISLYKTWAGHVAKAVEKKSSKLKVKLCIFFPSLTQRLLLN